MIVEATDRDALGRGVRSLLIRVARAANRVWQRKGAVISDRYHHRQLSTPREVRNALGYVLNNTHKHLHGCLKGIDPASSARWFAGTARDEPAVAGGRSWLLRVGWRRWGPIHLGEEAASPQRA